MDKIGDLMHQQFKGLPKEEKPALCRFDLVVRWPPHTKRRKQIFTYRGDHYEKDSKRMLWGLLRFVLKSYNQWLFARYVITRRLLTIHQESFYG